MLYHDFLTNDKRMIHKWVHYFPVYERYFSRFVNHSLVFLEIGVSKGGSLQMWKRYFGPFATIVGIDIDPACQSLEEKQVHVRIGDQSDPAFLQGVVDEFGPFDVILDDGSHIMRHVCASFHYLYDFVKEGGIYVIEDLHTAYMPDYEGGLKKEDTFIEKSKKFWEELNGNSDEVGKTTYSIDYYDSMIVLQKMNNAMRVMLELSKDNPKQKTHFLSLALNKYLNKFARSPATIWLRDSHESGLAENIKGIIGPLAFTVSVSLEAGNFFQGQPDADAFEEGRLFNRTFMEKLIDAYGCPNIVVNWLDPDDWDDNAGFHALYEAIEDNGVCVMLFPNGILPEKQQAFVNMCQDYIDLLNARHSSLDRSFANVTFSISFCGCAIILEKIKWEKDASRAVQIPFPQKTRRERMVLMLKRILPQWAIMLLKNIRKTFTTSSHVV